MDDAEYGRRVQQVLDAFSGDRDDYERLMDEMTVDCTEEQWQSLLEILESQRQHLEGRARDAKERVEKLPTFRPGRDIPALPGVVWAVMRTFYDHHTVVDMCTTRAVAAQVAEEDALFQQRLERPNAKTVPWYGTWRQADAHCPCSTPNCDHVQWTRKLRGGTEYIIQAWGVNDGRRAGDDPPGEL